MFTNQAAIAPCVDRGLASPLNWACEGMDPLFHICVISLGCAKNLVDAEVMCGLLATDGFVLTNDRSLADLVLVNTCGFIADARREAADEIEDALAWKRADPEGRAVAVAGCLTQRHPDRLARDNPEVDLFLALDDVPRTATILRRFLEGRRQDRRVPSGDLPTYLYDHRTPRLPLTPQSYAYLKIAEGCDHRCSYCGIPAIRGRQRSRGADSILAECRQMLDLGRRELNFIAQDTTRYGADLADGSSLEGLLRTCDRLGDEYGEYWIRVLYTHPNHITDELVGAMAEVAHAVPYLDVPLQHIATPVLRAMRRGMDGDATRRLMHRVRQLYPGIAVRTTFLVGFPGETEGDFQELLDFAAEYRFDRLGVFAFSPEEGTPAAAIDQGRIDPALREERRRALLEQQQAISVQLNDSLVGETVRVLIDGALTETEWVGRTARDAPEIDNLVQVSGKRGETAPGQFATVEIAAAEAYDLSGVITTAAAGGQQP